MPEDIIKPKGSTKRSSVDKGGSNPRIAPIIGIVKDNVDPTRSGKIMVYIADNSGLDPNDKANWRPVRFLPPYYGLTRPDAANDSLGTYKGNPSSYGMWMSPPDIDTQVVCVFINGDMNYGFYIGCIPEPEALTMVPAIGATDNIIPNEGEAKSYGGALRLPVTNINTNNKGIADSTDYLNAPKPIHSYSATIMNQQGIIRDPVRGPISSSSQRETPSRVGWGVSTPGRPIYEGGYDDTSIAENIKGDANKAKSLRVVSRRGGHTIVMDDGDIIGRDQLVRIRTALGHQILMSDDGQTLMILHSNGQSYIELGKEGTVDVFATNSINLRTQGDLNLHADNDINIHATKNLNLQGENIHLNSEKEYKQRTGADFSAFTLGKHTIKVSGAMSMESGGDISMATGAIAYVNGSKVNLNSGQTGTKPAEVQAIDKTLHTDTLFDKEKGWLAAPAKLTSITSRAPAHAPWSDAGLGVDVKNNPDASSNLPAAPSGPVQAANSSAASAGVDNPVQAATAATAPAAKASSASIDKQTTQALAGQAATDAANGPLKAAATQGTAVASTAGGTVVAAGKSIPQTAQQLETGGVLKPGAAALVTSVASATGNVAAAMPTSVFAGANGASSLTQFINNPTAQMDSFSKNIQVAQTKLQNAGIMSGAESASALGGMVLSTAKNGLDATLGAVKGSVAQAGGGMAGALAAGAGSISGPAGIALQGKGLSNKLSGAMKDIAGGNFAAKIGQAGAGALSGLAGSIEAAAKSPSLQDVISQSQGIAAGAFSAIKASMKSMTPGVPQNLTAIAKEAANDTMAVSASAAGSAATDAAALAKSKIDSKGLVNQAGQLLKGAALGALENQTNKLIDNALGKTLPNAGSVADSLVNAAKGSISGAVSTNITEGINQLSGAATVAKDAAGAFTNVASMIKNPAGSGSLVDIAKSQASGLAGSVSSIASGLSNLPGGQSAAASITNLAKNIGTSLPGTGDLKAAIGGSATNALNNVGNQLSGKASDLLGKATSKLDGLKSLASSGLPAGAAAQLQSALGSVAAAGSGIKVPALAVNTTDRSSIKAAVSDQLGDPAIPAPKFGEVDEGAKSKLEENKNDLNEYKKKQDELYKEYEALGKEMDAAGREMLKLSNDLPQGDPLVEQARKKFRAASKAWQAKDKEIEKYNNQFYARYPLGQTTPEGTEPNTGRILAGNSSTGIGSAT